MCNKCGWVHFEVSRDYVKQWLTEWLDHWLDHDENWRDAYGLKRSPPSAEDYLYCQRCNSPYTNFSECLPEKVPFGSTISPILNKNGA